MASTGKTLPGTAANDSSVGTVAWTNPDNIKLVGSGTADMLIEDPDVDSNFLVGKNFGFSIPAAATIKGVIVYFLGSTDAEFDLSPLDELLDANLYNSIPIGTEKSSGTLDDTEHSFGSATDKWSATLTPAIVNSANFGVALSIAPGTLDSYPATFTIDYVKMDVFYSLPGNRMLLGVG